MRWIYQHNRVIYRMLDIHENETSVRYHSYFKIMYNITLFN